MAPTLPMNAVYLSFADAHRVEGDTPLSPVWVLFLYSSSTALAGTVKLKVWSPLVPHPPVPFFICRAFLSILSMFLSDF